MLTPNGTDEMKLTRVKVYVSPLQRQQLRDAQSSDNGKTCHDEIYTGQVRQQLSDFLSGENVGSAQSLCRLAHQADWVSVCPLVTHCVIEKSGHNVANLRSAAWS